MVGIKIAIVCFVVMADMSGGKPPVVNVPETATVVVETTAAPTQAPTQAVQTPPRSDGFVAYRIYGITPPIEWQQYLYEQLNSLGYGWYMPYAVCQIFLESRWNQWSDNGRDFGLTQQKGIYWEGRCAHYGIPGADIWDVYAQLYVYSRMMCGFLAAHGGDIGWALSDYFLGTGEYSQLYVDYVMDNWGALEVVR